MNLTFLVYLIAKMFSAGECIGGKRRQSTAPIKRYSTFSQHLGTCKNW